MFRLSTLLLALTGVVHALDPAHLEREIESSINLRTHSIFPPYVDQDLQNRWFSFGADAYVNTNKHIRLTRDRPSETGWLWSRLPLTSTNFQVDVEFKIDGASSHVFGDGMAVWLTTRRAESGPVFGFIDKFQGLGIFIDTFANDRHAYAFPRISAMLGDGQTEYNNGNDGASTEIGGCSAQIRRSDIVTKMRIIYIKGEFLEVKLQYKAWDEWNSCFVLENPILPGAPFLGVSALTGEVHDAHDVVSISTSTIVLKPQTPGTTRNKKTYSKNKNGKVEGPFLGGFFSFFVKLIFVGVVGGVGFAGWKAYMARNGRGPNLPWDSKRF